MASCTRACRPAGWGRTASSVASTSLAEAEIALGSWLVSGARSAAEGTSRELLDMGPHFTPVRTGWPQACNLEAQDFATASFLVFGNISWVSCWAYLG